MKDETHLTTGTVVVDANKEVFRRRPDGWEKFGTSVIYPDNVPERPLCVQHLLIW